MNRRGFLAAGCACGTLACGLARAQATWEAPARFARPDVASDEGGLWSMMDREESRLRRSPFALRDPQLRRYVQDIACRLGGDHCPDIRIHLVRTPLFNASMAPNGMIQVWTGLLLRMENEAQLAAVLGHEIGHYLSRHSVERLRDAKSKSALAQFMGLFGVVGALGQLTVLASALAYSREQEREADRISVALMSKARYDALEAARVWENLLLEIKARPESEGGSPLFATHPAPEERQDALKQLAAAASGGSKNEDEWRAQLKPFMQEWLAEEVKRGRYDETIALATRLIASDQAQPQLFYARGEAYRLRGKETDWQSALSDFGAAARIGGEPAETHRGLAMVYRNRGRHAEAAASFRRYIDLAPEAPDAPLIKSYLEEAGT